MRASDLSDIVIVRWPAEAEARARAAADRRPRLLVIANGAEAPPDLSDLEDWVREPADPVELMQRWKALRRRVELGEPPSLDEHGLLRHDGRWTAVAPAQVPLLALLIERFGSLVPNDELADAYVRAGGSGNPTTIRVALNRLRARVADVGLCLRTAHNRGVVLEIDPSMRR